MKPPVPSVSVRGGTLVARFPKACRVLSWAPLGAGFGTARCWINHQVQLSEASRPPDRTLRKVARDLGLEGGVVGQMTGADIRRFQKAALTRKGWTVLAAGTAGFANAVRVGERARHESQEIGTINLLVWVSQPLALSTLLEVLQVAVEARTLAVLKRKIRCGVSGDWATGTGTDGIVIASPIGRAHKVYAGKHTVLGELVGKAVLSVIQKNRR